MCGAYLVWVLWRTAQHLAPLAYLWKPYPSVNSLCHSFPLPSQLGARKFDWSHKNWDSVTEGRPSADKIDLNCLKEERLIQVEVLVSENKKVGTDSPQGLTPLALMWYWATAALPCSPRPHGRMFCGSPSSNLASGDGLGREKHGERERENGLIDIHPLPPKPPNVPRHTPNHYEGGWGLK